MIFIIQVKLFAIVVSLTLETNASFVERWKPFPLSYFKPRLSFQAKPKNVLLHKSA